MKNKILFACLLVLSTPIVHAQPINGYPDSTFGANGFAIFDNAGQTEEIVKAAYGANGKLYVTGNTKGNNPSKIFIARFNVDGTLDPTFGSNGKVIFSPSADGSNGVTDMHISKDNKIVISGYANMGINFNFQQLIARFNLDGSLDISFNQAGYVLTGGPAHDRWLSCWVQDNGRIIAAGFSGSQAGSDMQISRFNSDGTLDYYFGFQGTQVFDYADEEFITKIYGHSNNVFYMTAILDEKATLLAIDSTGKLISSFGNNGLKSMNVVNGYVVDLKNLKTHNNDIYTCGYAINIQETSKWDVFIAKLDNTGKLYNNFGSNGYFRADLASTKRDICTEIDILSDGSVLGVGTRDKLNNQNNEVEMMTFLLASDGSLYSSYGTNGVMGYNAPFLESTVGEGMCKDNDNKITLFGISINNGNEDALLVKLKTVNSGNTSISELNPSDFEVNFYPNPIHDNLNVEFELSATSAVNFKLYNINGKVIKSLNFNSLPAGNQQLNLSEMISEIPAGVYYISVESTNFNSCYKILKY